MGPPGWQSIVTLRYVRWSDTERHISNKQAESLQCGSSPVSSHTWLSKPAGWPGPGEASGGLSTLHTSRATWWNPSHCGGTVGTMSLRCVNRIETPMNVLKKWEKMSLPTRGLPNEKSVTGVASHLYLMSKAQNVARAPPRE